MRVRIVCSQVRGAPWSVLLEHCDYFSSSSVVSCVFCALCVYSKFRHRPHPIRYLCAKFFFRGKHAELAHGEKSRTQSLIHPAYLMLREPKLALRNCRYYHITLRVRFSKLLWYLTIRQMSTPLSIRLTSQTRMFLEFPTLNGFYTVSKKRPPFSFSNNALNN